MSVLDKKRSGRAAAKTQTLIVDWEICEDESKWRFAQEAPPFTSSVQGWGRRWWKLALAVLLLVLASGGWLWYQSQEGLAKVEEELKVAIEADQWRAKQDDTLGTKKDGGARDIAALPIAGDDQLAAAAQAHLLDLGNDWAIVQATIAQGEISYRQTRLYRKRMDGWYTTAPTAALWGAPATLETTHFVFHYYTLDKVAVAAAGVKLDDLYPQLIASYPLDPAPNIKQEIWVSPEYTLYDMIPGSSGDYTVKVASPAIYWVPTTISEGDILAQAVDLALLDLYTEESVALQVPNTSQEYQAMQRIKAFLDGVRLWQIWKTELPLAALYKPTMQWIYIDGPRGRHTLPPFQAQLCRLHHLWRVAPYIVQIPLFCGDLEQMDHYVIGHDFYDYYAPPRTLAEIHVFTAPSSFSPYAEFVDEETMKLATVIDYAAATYGRESISALIANVANNSSWETLIPATFGISCKQFEAKWQAYLRQQYGAGQ